MTYELKCDRSFHGSVSGDVSEYYCRPCSRAASSKTVRVIVYHRWRRKGDGKIEKLKDRTVEKSKLAPVAID